MSNALTEVVAYIVEKLQKTNTNNPKANAGCVHILDHYEVDDISRLVDMSFQIIQMQFTKATTETPAGETRLTTVSSAIGNRICKPDENDGIFTKWEREVRVGDLFIEAYFNTGYVDLYYPKMRDGFHIVSATSKWTDLWEIDTETIVNNLKGTVTHKPEPITGMMQMHRHEEEPVIKGRTKDDPLDTDAVFVKAINKLQRTGWKVNTTILDAMLKDYKNFISFEEIEDNKPKELKRRSKLIEWAFITKKAEHLRDQTFYQFLEADYRGRLYYSEPFLNFQGSDIARGILQFARPKPMDQHGLFWLAVHTACSYNQSYGIDEIPDWCEADYATYLKSEGLESISVDKMTLEDRVRWTNESMDWIRDAGIECKFYHEAEKTISFLACCIEWHEFHVAEASGTIHRTHLPIPIDGSNNGWQHLGAISKDTMTGELVGLVPVDIQKDFYVQTAKELYNLVDGELKDILDRMPMKHIRKGISKRGSMTRAYSAGAAKIGENMWFDCKTEDYDEKYGLTEEHCMGFAKLLIKAISNVCPGPLKTMGYLQALAGVAIGQGADRLTWTTPSGFDVDYTCFYNKRCATKGTISGYTKYNKRGIVNHIAQVFTDFPDVRGFMCGVSPNYIHSMDAAHMALVIDKWNGDFGAVHDSFSAHAPDVELLLAHTKREFIDMYDVDNYYRIIEDQLVEDLDDVTTDRPVLGDLNIEEIEDSDYFFA